MLRIISKIFFITIVLAFCNSAALAEVKLAATKSEHGRPYVGGAYINLTGTQSQTLEAIPPGVTLTDVELVAAPSLFPCRFSFVGSQAEIGPVTEFSIYKGSGDILKLNTGLLSRGTLRIVIYSLGTSCEGQILLTGSRR